MDVLSAARRAALAGTLTAAAPAVVRAQAVPAEPPRITAPAESSLAEPGAGGRTLRLLRDPRVRPVLSLLVPGTGQLAAGQERGLVYLAVEVWTLGRAVALDRRGRRNAAHYRELAYQVARSPFSTLRRDGPFTYYETMERFVESGVYDRATGPDFVPESDTTTFNGSVWLLARRTFFTNPDSLPALDSPQYLSAVAFYRARATPGEFRWSWRDARLEQDVFRQIIRASDEAFRDATNYFGALVINHLVSAVDALISSRGAGARIPAAPTIRVGPEAAFMAWRIGF